MNEYRVRYEGKKKGSHFFVMYSGGHEAVFGFGDVENVNRVFPRRIERAELELQEKLNGDPARTEQ